MLSQNSVGGESADYVSHLIERVRQKRHACLREDSDFSVQFVEGVANLVIDLRIKKQDELIRVWVVHRAKPRLDGDQFKMPVHVLGEEDEPGEGVCFFADVGVENEDGIRKGFKGRGVFMSLSSQRILEISPPFWWITGYPPVDKSTRRRQCAEDSLNGKLGGRDSLYLYPTDANLWDAIRDIRLKVFPCGFTAEPSDDRLEVVDTFAGPL